MAGVSPTFPACSGFVLGPKCAGARVNSDLSVVRWKRHCFISSSVLHLVSTRLLLCITSLNELYHSYLRHHFMLQFCLEFLGNVKHFSYTRARYLINVSIRIPSLFVLTRNKWKHLRFQMQSLEERAMMRFWSYSSTLYIRVYL